MKKYYFTITGTEYRHGSDFLKEGMKVKLIKEPDNEYDKEAIKVTLTPIGTIGYVANSVKTVIGECVSAGRLYDKIRNEDEATILYVLPDGVIAVVDGEEILVRDILK